MSSEKMPVTTKVLSLGNTLMQATVALVPWAAQKSIGFLLSTGVLRILTDLSTFYGRKVGKFMAVNRPIYGDLFTGSRYK